MRKWHALAGAILVATSSPTVATGTEPPFQAHASQLCQRILNQIHDLPPSVKTVKQVTPANGDLWLRTTVTSFARLSTQLNALNPPPPERAQYRRMLSELKAASVSFAASKKELDAGDRAVFARDAMRGAVHAGTAAGIGQALKLGHCGP